MADDKKVIETITETITAQEQPKVVVVEDLEAKNATLAAEKVRLIEEAANYRVAYLKEKHKKANLEEIEGEQETDDERMKRIAMETLADSRLAEIAREMEAINRKALKENKELKFALQNKTDIPVSTTTHSEVSVPVRDTLITPEQEKNFRDVLHWTEKDIERYKKNLQKYGGK